MANIAVPLFNINKPFKLVDIGDGTYALATKLLTSPTAFGANDIAAGIFGTNIPTRLVSLGDNTFALAVATAVNPRPVNDKVIGFMWNNLPIRLVNLGDTTHALAVTTLTSPSSLGATDAAVGLFGINLGFQLKKQSAGDYSLGVATGVTPKPVADAAISMLGVGVPIRLVAMGDKTFALATAAQ